MVCDTQVMLAANSRFLRFQCRRTFVDLGADLNPDCFSRAHPSVFPSGLREAPEAKGYLNRQNR